MDQIGEKKVPYIRKAETFAYQVWQVYLALVEKMAPPSITSTTPIRRALVDLHSEITC